MNRQFAALLVVAIFAAPTLVAAQDGPVMKRIAATKTITINSFDWIGRFACDIIASFIRIICSIVDINTCIL